MITLISAVDSLPDVVEPGSGSLIRNRSPSTVS